ncbi:MAG: YidC/Oxa1 family insertase periplasmic-domain containing protein [Planctomycetota bacterium]
MDRRLFTFIIASTVFFLFYASLRALFVPPPPPPAAEEVAELNDAVIVEESDDPESPGDGESTEGESVGNEEEATERPTDPEWTTIGSMDPIAGYFMLVTLNSRGGGIERLELTERNADGELKYRRVDVRNGYLGYFAGQPALAVNGVTVNVVGPGTPAQMAGVEVGDIIVAVAGTTVASPEEISQALETSKPGDQVSVEVIRGTATTPIVLTATLTNHPLDLIRLAEFGGADQVAGNLSRLSCLVSLSQVNLKSILPDETSISVLPDPTKLVWDLESSKTDSAQSASFQLDLNATEMKAAKGGPISLVRTYGLAKGSYSLDLSVQLDNRHDQPQDLAFRLDGPNGISLEGWWYSTRISPNFSGAAARDVVYMTAADGHQLISGYDLLEQAKDKPKNPKTNIFAPDGDSDSRNLKYICVDSQYFTVGYVPTEGKESFTTFRRASGGVVADPGVIRRHQERAVNSTFYLDSVAATVPAGASLRQDLRLFAGPKQPELLEQYSLQRCIYYGWFSAFARFLAGILHILSGVGNYAIAIILLTVLVRGSMFPLSRKAAINAQKMQELAPELKKINEKYKDDMEGKLKAQRELQQRVGFNPLAGCLPMFLQLPIFMGLYRALSVDIELRQEAFSGSLDWASNLAGPDMCYFWGDWLWEYLSGRGTGWLGPYFNVLPVIVVVLFLAQQKLFMPPATDEQTAMTQKMMNIMTLMMGLFFFRVPAGLCVYFITSSMWGIGERILVKKTLPKGKHFDSAILDGTAAPGEKKSASIAERIRSQVAKPEAPIERPNKRKRPNKKKK